MLDLNCAIYQREFERPAKDPFGRRLILAAIQTVGTPSGIITTFHWRRVNPQTRARVLESDLWCCNNHQSSDKSGYVMPAHGTHTHALAYTSRAIDVSILMAGINSSGRDRSWKLWRLRSGTLIGKQTIKTAGLPKRVSECK